MMSSDKLTPLQRTVLLVLADLSPRWTLVGGAALAGFHLGHRTTRDLDLFWRQRDQLGELVMLVIGRCHTASLLTDVIQTAPAFSRLRVSSSAEVVVLDLVADPAPALVADVEIELGASRILVASPQEILVDKLCALLGRMEWRDLLDVATLVERGLDLDRALADAPRRDGGFSPLTLAWLLRSFDPASIAQISGADPQTGPRLLAFRDELITRLLACAKPVES